MSNLSSWVSEQARRGADVPALKLDDLVISYGLLDDLVGRCATLLAERGVTTGSTVALVMPNVPYFPVAYYAALKLGAIVVPLNPLLKRDELAYAWRDADVAVVMVLSVMADESLAAAAQTGTDVVVITPGEIEGEIFSHEPTTDVVDRADDETAVILYTSGTTGKPKGAELTHGNIASNVDAVCETLLKAASGEVFFGGLPFFHVFGQTATMNAAVRSGAMVTLLPRFDADQAWDIIERDAVNVLMGVPTMYVGLLAVGAKGRGYSSVRAAVSGGAALPVEVMKKFHDTFGFDIMEGYGLSETSPVVTFNHPDRPARPGTIGTAIDGVCVELWNDDGNRVADGEIGEIVVRGPNVMKRYWNKPAETDEAMRGGWFHTGDLATCDADGYYTIVDRKKDMIIRNGFNIYPREIEEVLYTHPDVIEAAVIGVPDDEHGEEIAAVVSLRDGSQASEDDIRQFAKDRLAAYKYPRIVRCGELPKGPTGKILKRSIVVD